NHIIRFLKQGDKVKAAVFFRGREIVHQAIGRALLDRLVEELSDICAVEARPKMEGPNLIAIFSPKPATGGGAKVKKKPAKKAHETKNPKGRGQALQNHSRRKSEAPAFIRTPHPHEESGGTKKETQQGNHRERSGFENHPAHVALRVT